MNESSTLLITLIPLLPLLGFVINGLGFKKIPASLTGLIGSAMAVGSFVLSILLLQSFNATDGATISTVYEWFRVADISVSFGFQIDQLSLLMLLIITGVGSLIHLYSAGYMHHDEGVGKFFAFLNLFLFSMLLLVLGNNYLIMFIGWEGVGLCSFLLIGFWNKNKDYNAAARKAFVMNRIGDLGFLLGIFLILGTFGTLQYTEVQAQAGTLLSIDSPVAIAITLLLFVGAMGKSAQIPLYTWLPDAMAGPTPVSALIHAATMVTAGIYMVVRSNFLFVLAPTTLEFIGFVGIATALLGASIGLMQNDIKKVLAYSTVSQLGYMFLALGVAAFSSAMFHVITHAFFKALLFLGAGSVIHALHHEQDIRKMGGLSGKLKITYITFLIGTIAIAGIPPFAGFFSKDEILAHVFEHNKVLWVLGLVGSFMTAFYMFRLLILTFYGSYRGKEDPHHPIHESPITITLPLMVLAVFSIVGGFMGLPEVFSHTHKLSEFMEPLFATARTLNPELMAGHAIDHSTEWLLMGVSVAVALVAATVAFVMYGGGKNVPASDEESRGFLGNLIYNKWYVDELYDTVIVKPLNFISEIVLTMIEVLVIDLFVNLVGLAVQLTGGGLRRLQLGATNIYLLFMVLGIVVLLTMQLFFN